MNLILQAVKSLIRKAESSIATNAAKSDKKIKQALDVANEAKTFADEAEVKMVIEHTGFEFSTLNSGSVRLVYGSSYMVDTTSRMPSVQLRLSYKRKANGKICTLVANSICVQKIGDIAICVFIIYDPDGGDSYLYTVRYSGCTFVNKSIDRLGG